MAFLLITLAVVAMILGIAAFTKFELHDEAYDRLKWLAIRWSVITTFIGVIVQTFEIAYGTQTVTIVAAIGALLAGLLGISAMNYYGNAKDYSKEVQTTFNAESMGDMMEGNYDEAENYSSEQ